MVKLDITELITPLILDPGIEDLKERCTSPQGYIIMTRVSAEEDELLLRLKKVKSEDFSIDFLHGS